MLANCVILVCNMGEQTPRPRIAKVYLFQNGIVMSADEQGNEIKEFCGWRGDVREKILEFADESTEFFEVATVGRATSAIKKEKF